MAVLEISDLIAAWDPVTGERLPVARTDVLARLRAAGDERAVRIVEQMPASDGILEPGAVDRLYVRVHTELQRLGEELHLARRFTELLVPVLAAVRAAGWGPPLRVVDIGCGVGFVVRTLAASGILGTDVELLGVDQNPVLVAEAARLADDEGLPCRFVCGDAFALTEAATVYLSSGLLHHLHAGALPDFFGAQVDRGAAAFIHYDIASTRLAPLGAWVFHRARMREPLGRHDGVASARRAHDHRLLLAAAAQAQGMDTFVFRPVFHTNPFCAAMHPVVGIRPELAEGFRRALGRRARWLVGASGGGEKAGP